MAPDLALLDWLNPCMWAAIAAANEPIRPPASLASLPSSLAKPLEDLAEELQASLHKAYYGPSLHDLPVGHLPPAFEADHRSMPGAGDVLQIVSGQTVLASVREARQAQLCGYAEARAGQTHPQQLAQHADMVAAPLGAGSSEQQHAASSNTAAMDGARDRLYTSAAAKIDSGLAPDAQAPEESSGQPDGQQSDTPHSAEQISRAADSSGSTPHALEFFVEDEAQVRV